MVKQSFISSKAINMDSTLPRNILKVLICLNSECYTLVAPVRCRNSNRVVKYGTINFLNANFNINSKY